MLLALCLSLDSESSDEEIEDVFILKKHRESRHDLFQNRNMEGAFAVLINRHLMDNDTKFKEYLRLTPYLFAKILGKIENELVTKPSIRYPKPIEPKLKLCLVLR